MNVHVHACVLQTPSLIDYKEYHTDVSVRFQLEVVPERMAEWQAAGIEAKLKLTSKFATSACAYVQAWHVLICGRTGPWTWITAASRRLRSWVVGSKSGPACSAPARTLHLWLVRSCNGTLVKGACTCVPRCSACFWLTHVHTQTHTCSRPQQHISSKKFASAAATNLATPVHRQYDAV